jgi:hypothetical protein
VVTKGKVTADCMAVEKSKNAKINSHNGSDLDEIRSDPIWMRGSDLDKIGS